MRSNGFCVCDELVSDLMQRHLGHIQPLRGDQLQQQVKRPLEIVQSNLKSLGRFRRDRHTPPNRSMTSRANDRYASAPPDFGAHVVIGSPATLVSGNRTVRVITVSNTRSANRSTT